LRRKQRRRGQGLRKKSKGLPAAGSKACRRPLTGEEEEEMEKVPQKLDKTRAEYYKGAPIAKFGERPAPTTGMGRKMKNPHKNLRQVVCVEACRTP